MKESDLLDIRQFKNSKNKTQGYQRSQNQVTLQPCQVVRGILPEKEAWVELLFINGLFYDSAPAHIR